METSRPTSPVRIGATIAGILLLGIAILVNQWAISSRPVGLIFADHYPPYRGQPLVFSRSANTPENAIPLLEYLGQSKVFVRHPWMPHGQYRYLPLWWLLAGLALLVLGTAFCFPAFRRAVAAPWKKRDTALPLALTLAYLLFSLIPWDHITAKPYETGTALVLYLSLATSGFILLVTGVYHHLLFLDQPARAFYNWLMRLEQRRFLILAAGFTFLVTNLISFFVFEHMPHIQDSISQHFQARIFATGRLYLPSPPFPDFFDYTHIINNGRWYSQYPFLHSLILLPGVLIGAPWIINPLLGALFVPALYHLGRELYDERTGRLATVLACFTPFILNMSSEFMNHTSALLFTTLFLIFYFRAIRPEEKTNAIWPLLAGLFLGMVVNIRPYTAAALALPFGLYGIRLAVREPRRYIGRFALMLLTLGATSSLLLIYNWLTNGHPLLFGYVVKWGPGHEVGFGKSAWGPMHTPLKGLLNTGNDHNLLNRFLFEWPIPSILPMAALFAGGTRDRRDWLLLAAFLSLTWAHFFYWFHNVCFGPRFLYEASPALLLLTVRGFSSLGTLLRRTFQLSISDGTIATFTGRTLPLMLLFMLGSGLPPLFRLYHTYGGVSQQVQRNVRRLGLKNALVFCEHLGNGFSANSLELNGNVVYAKDYGMLINAALTVRYPDRYYFFAKADTIRPIEEVRFPQSRLRTVLGYLNTFLIDSIPLNQYRYVIWPFADLPPLLPEQAPPVVDYRQVSREIFTGRRQLEDYLPAIGCWLLNDSREHLKIFSYMNDVQHFISDRFKFTLLNISAGAEAVIYDIRPATGQEITLPR